MYSEGEMDIIDARRRCSGEVVRIEGIEKLCTKLWSGRVWVVCV
jgi:hypothetical protein